MVNCPGGSECVQSESDPMDVLTPLAPTPNLSWEPNSTGQNLGSVSLEPVDALPGYLALMGQLRRVTAWVDFLGGIGYSVRSCNLSSVRFNMEH